MMQERGLKPPEMERRLKPPIDQTLKCPRCDSYNTKFCYYNNYSLSQPRHFCKNCRRYWTKGGALRNVPVGGGCRKNKRAKQKTCPDHVHNQAFICSPDHNNSACPSLSPTSAFYTLPVGANDINLASLARAQQAALRLSDQQHHHHASSLSSAGCYGLSDTAHLSSMRHSAFSNHLQSLRSGLIAPDFAGKAKPEPGTNSSMPDLSAFINPASHQLSNMPAVSSDISKEHINGFSLGLDSLNAEMQWRLQQHRLKEEVLHRQADHGHVLLRLEEANQNEHAETLRHSASSNTFKDVEEGSKELESWHAEQGGIFEGANGEQNYWTNGAWPSDFSMYGPSATPLL